MLSVKLPISTVLLLFSAVSAFAFGTIHGLGQDAEHERITRHALACEPGAPSGSCFQSDSLDMLAGKSGSVGAVGLPDVAMITQPEAHCDMGDHLDVAGYPQSLADANHHLTECRRWMTAKLDEAVHDAEALVDAKGNIDESQYPSLVSCTFGTGKGRAKCNVIEDFGVLLHASEDFYSHTNWVDRPDSSAPVGSENPPGLGNTGPAPWLDLRRPAGPVPAGLISGCFEMIPESSHCNYGPSGSLHRAKHDVLNKDEGQIDPRRGAGRTKRGSVNDNFQRAVDAAILDARDKWATLSEKLVAVYGEPRGRKMICVLTHDRPGKAC